MKCDDCDEAAEFLLYAAYPVIGDLDGHPRVARYPGAMHRSCRSHLAEHIKGDASKPGASEAYVVELVAA